jgi:hypothetical protein
VDERVLPADVVPRRPPSVDVRLRIVRDVDRLEASLVSLKDLQLVEPLQIESDRSR